MGQKVNPHGLRVGVIKDWDSRWFTTDKKEFGSLLLEDHQIRTFLKERLYVAGVAKIEIERSANKIRIDLHVAKPGVVIGAAGTGRFLEMTSSHLQCRSPQSLAGSPDPGRRTGSSSWVCPLPQQYR